MLLKIALIIFLLVPKLCFAAIHADTIWEVRQGATANNVNGGGFNSSNASPGTDRSQQDAAFDSGTDLASADGDAVPAVITSASHNFVAADHGNIIHITETGDGFTVGWYEIVSTATNAATLDRAVGTDGAKTGGDWYLGGAMSLNSTLDDDFFEQTVAGNIIYMENNDSPYSLGENIELITDGTSALPINIIGYNDTDSRTVIPTGTDRPLIAAGSTITSWDNDWTVKNLRLTTTATGGLRVDTGGIIENCASNNSNAGANRNAFWADHSVRVINCDGQSALGGAFFMGAVVKVISCYAHDSNKGYDMSSHQASVLKSIADTCTTSGINLGAARESNTIVGNVIYNCGTGIIGSTSIKSLITDNIIAGNVTKGISWTSEIKNNVFDYNTYDDNTGGDTSNVTKGVHSITDDPLLTDPTADPPDFTLQAGSPCLKAGLQVGTNEGVVGDYKINIGVDQDDNVAGGAGGGRGARFLIQ